MFWHSKLNKHPSMLAVPVLLLMAHGSMQADPATVASLVSVTGPNYLYDFAITNNTSTDPYGELVSVDFSLPAGSSPSAVTAPAGNGEVSDPSGNFVEFSSNNVSGFAVGVTVDGFKFTSPLKFASLPFTANYLNHAETMVTTFNATTSPLTPASVPEPGTLGLLAGASVLLFSRIRSLRAR